MMENKAYELVGVLDDVISHGDSFSIVINTGPHLIRFVTASRPPWPVGSPISIKIGYRLNHEEDFSS